MTVSAAVRVRGREREKEGEREIENNMNMNDKYRTLLAASSFTLNKFKELLIVVASKTLPLEPSSL